MPCGAIVPNHYYFQFPLIRLQIIIGDIELDIAEGADMNGTLVKLKSGQDMV
ncbi:hypothetical protein COO91_08558 [Nostoc flagelliforme CCNUN1]|uniref:Uncharacterized protein n=1 Tax=Nostoc flagelliforme CCNUN1 TaxID=2038116 RepID=A0A2K8T484_9NOSO|nr:hypothetical protein COO91_08558 [Nostoc flagelliforme CCNUN1]